MKCPKCGEEMEKGIIPDNRYGGWSKLSWIDKIVHFKWKPANQAFEIEAYRCKKCGFLELYANTNLYK